MAANDSVLGAFSTRLQQLIAQYKAAVDEREQLQRLLKEKNDEAERLQEQVAQLQRDYAALKIAQGIARTEEERTAAKARLTKMIRDINRCITYINDKE